MVWTEKYTIDGMAFYLETDTNEVSWQKPEALMSEEEIKENQGEWVWVPHPTDMWQEGKVQKRDDDGAVHVLLNSGSLMRVPPSREMEGTATAGRKQVVPLWELKKSNLRFLEDDLVMLDPVNEAFIIRNLAQRYAKKQIYTWVGAGRSVLVSVNPYQDMGLYGDDQIDLHRNKPPNKPVPPHVFDIANDSYDSMAFERADQSILISGESGAGKTEATKQCLKYIAAIAGSESKVEEKVLVANPLLEAFGNAKTIRNINSSRFGKWMEVYFNKQTSKMQGAKITNYLLERSRVVHQQKNERNYHIFYELCTDSDCIGKYSLQSPESYQYLSQSGCVKVPQIDDQKEFDIVKSAMDLLEFTPAEKESVLQLTAAVLWLGNVEFEAKQHKGSVDGSSVKAGEAIQRVSKLLALEEEAVAKILCYRTIRPKAGHDSAVIPLSTKDARTACDSLAMGIYGKLFNWMVGRVNDSLGDPSGRFIGILDIFGFEIFDNNSFEQLCINYANEKLQQLFNKTTFKEEEELYRSEGVNYTPIHFIDNQPVLDLVEDKPKGILPVLDDECLIPEGSDQKFMNKIEDYHGGKACFQTDSQRRFENNLSFEIRHYAGVVLYDASEFMTKNVDTVFDDMYMAMAKSNNELLKIIFDSSDRKIKTLSYQFRGQLQTLMNTLYTTESRFIRCIKPNDDLSPNKFIASSCIEQLRYSGVFEAVDIRKTGYPFRYTHKRFVYRYSCINPGHKYKTGIKSDYVDRAKEILDVSKQDFSNVQLGNTMVLYRANEYKLLKLLRNLALETLIPKSQSVIRGGLARCYFRNFRPLVAEIDRYIKKADDHDGLSKAIDASDPSKNFEREQLRLFNYTPRNMNVAKVLLKELAEWLDLEKKMRDVKELCEKSKPDRFYEQLKALDKQVTDKINRQNKKERETKENFYRRKAYKKPKLTKAQKDLHNSMKDLIHACILGQLDEKVEKAVANFDRKGIIASLEEADKLKHKTAKITEARALLDKFEVLDEDAKKAVSCVSKTMLEEVLKNASELRQDNEHLQAAKKMFELDEKAFVEEEYARAKEVGDDSRKTHRELKLMEFKYNEMDHSKYTLETMASYREPAEFAKAKFSSLFFGKEALMTSMKVWSNKLIPTSLVKPQVEVNAAVEGNPSPEQKQRIKWFKTEAKRNFKSILIYTGDKNGPDRNEAASDILRRGLQAYNDKDNDMLMELYVQVIKQLTNSPTKGSADYRAAPDTLNSYQNCLALLAMMTSVFPPCLDVYQTNAGGNATFDDVIIIWIMNNITEADRKRFLSAMNNVKYDSKATQDPQPSVVRNQFAELKGKYSLDSEADSGPEPDKIELYLKGSE